MSFEPSLVYLNECVSVLQSALDVFISHIGRPKYIESEHRFKYRASDPRLFQVLKCVKVVSTYNAAICLLREGYVQEVGALIRMAFEFLHDIDFIEQGVVDG